MAFFFLFYKVNRKFPLSCFFPLFLLQHPSHHMHYTPLFLLFYFVPPFLSTPLPLCNLCITCAIVAFYPRTLVLDFPGFWCLYNCTLNLVFRFLIFILHKHHHFPSHDPSFHTHFCSSRRQPLCPRV